MANKNMSCKNTWFLNVLRTRLSFAIAFVILNQGKKNKNISTECNIITSNVRYSLLFLANGTLYEYSRPIILREKTFIRYIEVS